MSLWKLYIIYNSNELNSAVNDMTKILFDSAFSVFGRSVLQRNDTKEERPNNEWFDNNCVIARDNFHRIRNFYFHHPTDANRQSYVLSRNNYNKLKRKAQFSYKRRKGIELCDIANTEPKKFWSAVNRKTKYKCKVVSDIMLKHFESLLGDDPPALCDEVLNLINNIKFNDIIYLTWMLK